MDTASNDRRRSHDDISNDDDNTLVDEEDERMGRPAKRVRRSLTRSLVGEEDVDNAEEGAAQESSETDPDDNILPDSYRRSPKNKRQTAIGQGESTQSEHQSGSIVRVSLQNFVTYTKAEFFPGPNLNMVIGPNGTGKSTLVCAICLGLGWSPKHLGRAKQIGEFVKHGSKTAYIEIELAADPQRHSSNPVIKTRITRDGVNADFSIDDQRCPKKHVQALAKSFAIQVDNLCQFLPQDRVAEFATLTPVRLLEATQRAAAPEYMSEWYEDLKVLGKKQKTKTQEQQVLMGQLKSLDNRQKAQQADVDRLRQRSSLQSRLKLLEKGRPIPSYRTANAEYRQTKKLYKRACREVTRLEAQLQPNTDAVNAKEIYRDKTDAAIQSRKHLLEHHMKACNTKRDRFNQSETSMQEHKSSRDQEHKKYKELKVKRQTIMHSIKKLEQDILLEPPPMDIGAVSEKVRDKTRQIRELEAQERESREVLRTMNSQLRQKRDGIESRTREKDNLQSQLGRQTSRLETVNKEAARGWKWLQQNRHRFAGPVFGPVMLECSVKNSVHAPAIEAAIGPADLVAFTVTSKADYETLVDAFHGRELSLKESRARIAPDVETFNPQRLCSDETLRQMGLEGWLVDLLDGPREVIAGLCDNNGLNTIGYTSRDLTASQSQALEKSPITSWVTRKESWSISRRRDYGEHAVSKRVQSLRPARCFTDAPVNRDREARIDRAIQDLRVDCTQLEDELKSEQNKLRQSRTQLDDLIEEKTALENEKNHMMTVKTRFEAIPTKLEGEKKKLADTEQSIADAEDAARTSEDDLDKLQLKLAKAAIEVANALERSRFFHTQVLEAELQGIEAASDIAQLKQRDAAEREQLSIAQDEQKRLEAEKDNLQEKRRNLYEQCRSLLEDVDDEEKGFFDTLKQWSPEQLETEIESTKAHLEMHAGGNANAINEYEERARKIDRLHAQLNTLIDSLDEMKTKISDIRTKWEPELDEIIGKISSAFSDNFAAISCAGEVSIYKDEDDFEEWSIQIKVKFRESEALSILDSHRQSGGERSVSTIFYLMALQSLARAPFRVVDEINQGMDPRNERMVHSRLVSIACEARREDGGGGSQYFLITPKLLTGLEYHPNMKIHCIASGEWMPDDHSSINFDALARKALSIRAA